MVLDANGRNHRPKGLPRGLAGTYDANAAAVRDTDLTVVDDFVLACR